MRNPKWKKRTSDATEWEIKIPGGLEGAIHIYIENHPWSKSEQWHLTCEAIGIVYLNLKEKDLEEAKVQALLYVRDYFAAGREAMWEFESATWVSGNGMFGKKRKVAK